MKVGHFGFKTTLGMSELTEFPVASSQKVVEPSDCRVRWAVFNALHGWWIGRLHSRVIWHVCPGKTNCKLKAWSILIMKTNNQTQKICACEPFRMYQDHSVKIKRHSVSLLIALPNSSISGTKMSCCPRPGTRTKRKSSFLSCTMIVHA